MRNLSIIKNYQTSELHGKTALITGGATRIGKTIALTLSSKGADIILHYNKAEKEAKKTSLEIKKNKTKCYLVKSDFSKPKEIKSIFKTLRKNKIKVDILINNASVFTSSTLKDISAKEFLTTYMVNAFAPLLLSLEFYKQTKKGSIINILDSRIKGINKKYISYALSKKTLYEITKLLAFEFAPYIRVNAIAPGLILASKDENWEQNKLYEKRNLLKKIGKPSFIADAVLFLISNDFITGETIFIDAGQKIKTNIYGL